MLMPPMARLAQRRESAATATSPSVSKASVGPRSASGGVREASPHPRQGRQGRPQCLSLAAQPRVALPPPLRWALRHLGRTRRSWRRGGGGRGEKRAVARGEGGPCVEEVSARVYSAEVTEEATRNDGSSEDTVDIDLGQIAKRAIIAIVALVVLVGGLALLWRDELFQLGEVFVEELGLAGLFLGFFLPDAALPLPHDVFSGLCLLGGVSFATIVGVASSASLLGGSVGFYIGRRLSHTQRFQRIMTPRGTRPRAGEPLRWPSGGHRGHHPLPTSSSAGPPVRSRCATGAL